MAKPEDLEILKKLQEVHIRPLGMDKSLVKYFELVDTSINRMLLVGVATSPNEDLSIRDMYGAPRFRLHGTHFKGQLDVYRSYTRPIGIVKSNVMYDHECNPVYTIAYGVACCGPPSMKILKYNAKTEVGYINPDAASVMVGFEQGLDARIKALIIGAAFQQGLTKYRMDLIQFKTISPDSLFKTKKKDEDRKKSKVTKKAAKEAEVKVEADKLEEEKAKADALAKELEEQTRRLSEENRQRRLADEAELKRLAQEAEEAEARMKLEQLEEDRRVAEEAEREEQRRIEEAEATEKEAEERRLSAERKAEEERKKRGSSAMEGITVIQSHFTSAFTWDEAFYNRKKLPMPDARGGAAPIRAPIKRPVGAPATLPPVETPVLPSKSDLIAKDKKTADSQQEFVKPAAAPVSAASKPLDIPGTPIRSTPSKSSKESAASESRSRVGPGTDVKMPQRSPTKVISQVPTESETKIRKSSPPKSPLPTTSDVKVSKSSPTKGLVPIESDVKVPISPTKDLVPTESEVKVRQGSPTKSPAPTGSEIKVRQGSPTKSPALTGSEIKVRQGSPTKSPAPTGSEVKVRQGSPTKSPAPSGSEVKVRQGSPTKAAAEIQRDLKSPGDSVIKVATQPSKTAADAKTVAPLKTDEGKKSDEGKDTEIVKREPESTIVAVQKKRSAEEHRRSTTASFQLELPGKGSQAPLKMNIDLDVNVVKKDQKEHVEISAKAPQAEVEKRRESGVIEDQTSAIRVIQRHDSLLQDEAEKIKAMKGPRGASIGGEQGAQRIDTEKKKEESKEEEEKPQLMISRPPIRSPNKDNYRYVQSNTVMGQKTSDKSVINIERPSAAPTQQKVSISEKKPELTSSARLVKSHGSRAQDDDFEDEDERPPVIPQQAPPAPKNMRETLHK